MTHFAHIAPTAYLTEFAEGRPFHLLLAHLVEEDPTYAQWYYEHKQRFPDTVYVMDNSAFEMYKQGRPMYPSEKLVEMGRAVQADYIVLTDYPGENTWKGIMAAEALAPVFKEAGFKTFFCPQSEIGNFDDLVHGFEYATGTGIFKGGPGPQLIDYIGVSILGVPNAYGVERGNKLQRFTSRWAFMRTLFRLGILDKMKDNGQKLHFLGMVDGPNEIELVEPFLPYIDSWDSSAAVWAGLNDIKFDFSPTGLLNGKFEKEVDFSFSSATPNGMRRAQQNVATIESMLSEKNSITGIQRKSA